MIEGVFGGREQLHIEPLTEEAKLAISDANLIFALKHEADKIKQLEEFVRYAQEDSARARNFSDEDAIESAKRSTAIRFGLLGLSEETSQILTNAIYAR